MQMVSSEELVASSRSDRYQLRPKKDQNNLLQNWVGNGVVDLSYGSSLHPSRYYLEYIKYNENISAMTTKLRVNKL